MLVEHNRNGSITISCDGDRTTFYGYAEDEAIAMFLTGVEA